MFNLKNKKLLMLFLLTALFLANFSAAAGVVEDLAGRSVFIPAEIEKIAAVGPGALRLVVYLKAEEMVVGVEEFEKRNPQRPYILAKSELLNLEVIGPQFGGDRELIAAQNPDLIIASYLSRSEIDNLQSKTGIPVVSINDRGAGSMSEKDLKRALNFLAEILNKKAEAEKIISIFESYKDDLKKRSTDSAKMKLYIGGIGNRGAQGITSTEANYPPFVYLGLDNIIKRADKSNFSINKEKLFLEDPALIFIDQGGLALVKKDLKRKEFKYLKAYQNGDIYQLLPYNQYTTNFATMFADAYYIGKIIYPEQFSDIEPEKKAGEIYTKFFQKNVYPQMKNIYGGFKKMELK